MNTTRMQTAPEAGATLTRRGFVLGGGAVTVGLGFGPALGLSGCATTPPGNASFTPVAWVTIDRDNMATIYSAGSEMGQGTMTALPMVLAEDMELDWSKVKVVQAPADPKRFGNPRFGGGMVTGASRTVTGYYEPLRLAGLQGKLVMLGAAATAWNVPVAELRAENSTVIHGASGRRISYGELARTAVAPAELPKVDKAMLKPMAQFKVIGKDLPRVDLAAKTDGSAIYGIDVRLPGMLYATLLPCPVQGDKAESVDDAAAKAMPGVKAVVVIPTGVAVVADSFYTARKARELLNVKWTSSSRARRYDSDAAMKEYVARAENMADAGVAFHNAGDAPQRISGAARVIKATYTSEHVAQFTLEPMNCTAKVDGDKIELWVPSQTVGFVMGGVAAAGGFKPENIKVNITLLGGGYGRRVEAEYAVDAALIAKAVPGVAVQMIWTREDDMTRSKPRPLAAQHMVAGVDASGRIVGLQHRVTAEGVYARVAPPAFRAAGNKDAPVMEFFRNRLRLRQPPGAAVHRRPRHRLFVLARGGPGLPDVRHRNHGRRGGCRRPQGPAAVSPGHAGQGATRPGRAARSGADGQLEPGASGGACAGPVVLGRVGQLHRHGGGSIDPERPPGRAPDLGRR